MITTKVDKSRGQDHHLAKLTDREVELMRMLRELHHWTYDALAAKFDITKGGVQAICTYRVR